MSICEDFHRAISVYDFLVGLFYSGFVVTLLLLRYSWYQRSALFSGLRGNNWIWKVIWRHTREEALVDSPFFKVPSSREYFMRKQWFLTGKFDLAETYKGEVNCITRASAKLADVVSMTLCTDGRRLSLATSCTALSCNALQKTQLRRSAW